MDRKDFFRNIWEKALIPLGLIIVISYCIKFLVLVFTRDSSERLIVTLIVIVILLGTLSYLFGLILEKTIKRISLKLSERTKYILRVTGKVGNYILPYFVGAGMYHFGQKEWLPSVILAVYLLNIGIRQILNEERISLIDKNEIRR